MSEFTTDLMDPAQVVAAVRQVLDQAGRAYAGTEGAAYVQDLQRRIEEPLRVAIAGKVKAGKSTLLNGLVGQKLAPTDAGECTKIVTWYTDGVSYRATLYPHGGELVDAQLSLDGGAIDVDLGSYGAPDIERIVVEWPSSSLAEMTLVDTPGIASISTDISSRTVEFMTASDGRESQADAVIYLMRHFHPSDARFLESFHDDEIAKPNPINAIGVLSRADELGDGGPRAMNDARRIAGRYRNDAKIRRLCQTIVPVSGLLAQAGATLRQSDYNLLERLAQLPATDLSLVCASADRFIDPDQVGSVTGADRTALLDLLGLHGVRLAVGLIASGEVTSAPGLANRLIEASGLEELRSVLASQFAARRDILKSHSTIQALEHLVRSTPPPSGADDIEYELERIRAGAHVFAQLQLFAAFRAGSVTFKDSEHDEVERLLGGSGFGPRPRLALGDQAADGEVRAAAMATLARWQRRAESTLASRDQVQAARTLVQTCEAILAALPPDPPVAGTVTTF